MSDFSKYCKLVYILGARVVADELYDRLTTDTANEYFDDIASDYDINFCDEYGD